MHYCAPKQKPTALVLGLFSTLLPHCAEPQAFSSNDPDHQAAESDANDDSNGPGAAGPSGAQSGSGLPGQNPNGSSDMDTTDSDASASDPMNGTPPGTTDGGSDDATGPHVIPAPLGALRLQFKDNGAQQNQIEGAFNIVNTGDVPVPLSSLTVRYYYTRDVDELAEIYQCFFADALAGSCSNITASFGEAEGENADTYLELGFNSGTLGPGSEVREVQLAIHAPNWSTNYDKTNDYSRGAGATLVEWPRVTLYQGGTFVWGIEPDGTTPVVSDAGANDTDGGHATDAGSGQN